MFTDATNDFYTDQRLLRKHTHTHTHRVLQIQSDKSTNAIYEQSIIYRNDSKETRTRKGISIPRMFFFLTLAVTRSPRHEPNTGRRMQRGRSYEWNLFQYCSNRSKRIGIRCWCGQESDQKSEISFQKDRIRHVRRVLVLFRWEYPIKDALIWSRYMFRNYNVDTSSSWRQGTGNISATSRNVVIFILITRTPTH